MAKKRIAILYLGGSIGMKRNNRTGKLYSIESVDEIYKHMPEVQIDVSLSYFTLNAVGSSDITPEHWHELLHVLQIQYTQVDGFVVIHGTNTMAYTAAAVAFALQGLNKPIVFTGALLPLNSPLGDGRFNLQHAILAASSNIAEVCTVMDARVYRGVRAHKVKHSMFHSFYSPHLLPIADIHSLPEVAGFTLLRRHRTLEYAPDFESNIVSIQLFPGFSEQVLYTILKTKPAGVVLHTYGQGMVSSALLPWFKQAKEEGVAVLLVSQAKEGAINMYSFEKQEQFERLGAISAKNMTAECATVKFMWALKHFTRFDHLKNFMERSIVGELD
jgi:L-asparaginase